MPDKPIDPLPVPTRVPVSEAEPITPATNVREAIVRYVQQRVDIADVAKVIDTGKALQLNERDAKGRSIIYYSFGDDGLPSEQASALHAKYDNDEHTKFSVPPAMRKTFLTAAREFERNINVVFLPISQAPAGKHAQVVLATFTADKFYGMASFPGEDAILRIDRETALADLGTMFHELGHQLGLSHPKTGSKKLNYSKPESDRVQSLSWNHAVTDYSSPFSPLAADMAVLQKKYGVSAELSGNDTYRFTVRSTEFGQGYAVSDSIGSNTIDLSPNRTKANMNADTGAQIGELNIFLTSEARIDRLVGTRGKDTLTSSFRHPTIMMGGRREDHYVALPTIAEGEHHVIDSGTNTLELSVGARVRVDYERSQNNTTMISTDFAVKSIEAVTLPEGRMALFIFPMQGAPTMVNLPSNDQYVMQGHLFVYDRVNSTSLTTEFSKPSATPSEETKRGLPSGPDPLSKGSWNGKLPPQR